MLPIVRHALFVVLFVNVGLSIHGKERAHKADGTIVMTAADRAPHMRYSVHLLNYDSSVDDN